MLRLEALVKEYRTGDRALTGVDLEVPQGHQRKAEASDLGRHCRIALGIDQFHSLTRLLGRGQPNARAP